MSVCFYAAALRVASVVFQLFATPWTAAPLSMGFSRQEYWSGLPVPSVGDLPDPGVKPASPGSLALHTDSLATVPPGKPSISIDVPIQN